VNEQVPAVRVRGLTRFFDSGEARNHFATEAGFFAAIVLTAAVPVAKAIGGLFHFVQTVGVL
jgi:hypothetical protein